jgi:hypothetical protein
MWPRRWKWPSAFCRYLPRLINLLLMRRLAGILIVCCMPGKLPAQVVERATVFKKFLPANTTMGFVSAFSRLPTPVDTTNVTSELLTPADFTTLLATARQKKHHQMKIAGVRFAGLMQIDGQQHRYLYCGPTLLIDLTSRVNYWLAPATAAAFDTKSKRLPFKD